MRWVLMLVGVAGCGDLNLGSLGATTNDVEPHERHDAGTELLRTDSGGAPPPAATPEELPPPDAGAAPAPTTVEPSPVVPSQEPVPQASVPEDPSDAGKPAPPPDGGLLPDASASATAPPSSEMPGAVVADAGSEPMCAEDSPEFVCGSKCELPRGPAMAVIWQGDGIIGSPDLPNTQPVFSPAFATFCIDVTEVTLADYRSCVEASGCTEPLVEAWDGCNWLISDKDQHPVNCVDVEQARSYCQWLGKRLPSEQEWEYAARGTEGRLYPWGDQSPDGSRLNYALVVGDSTPVAAYPLGATPEGVYDLGGNVWEWTDTEWCDSYSPEAQCTPGSYIAKGGSWASQSDDFVRPSWRDSDNAGGDRFGFRCVKDSVDR